MSAHPHTPGPGNDVVDREDLKVSASFELDEDNDPGFELVRGQQVEVTFRGFVTGISEKDGKDGDRKITVRTIEVKGAWGLDVSFVAAPSPRARLGEIPGQTTIDDAVEGLRESVGEGGSLTISTGEKSATITGKAPKGETAGLDSAARPPRRVEPAVIEPPDDAAAGAVARLANGDLIHAGATYTHTGEGWTAEVSGWDPAQAAVVLLDPSGTPHHVTVRDWPLTMVNVAAVERAIVEHGEDPLARKAEQA
jgi:hypothetical protein